MSEVANTSLPPPGLCKLMFRGSQETEGEGGHLGNFHFSFRTPSRNDSCCLSDLLKIAPHKKHFFVCVTVHTGFVL